MRNISIIMLLAALVLGGITVFFTKKYIETRPANQAERVEGVSAAMETSTIVVATVPLRFGDEVTPDQLREVEWPADLKPEGSFESIETLIGSERRVTLRSINVNEPIVKNKISGFGYRATLSQIIGDGKRAVTIRVNDVVSVGGFVLPGDEVDVLLSYQDGEHVLDMVTKIILQNVRVLAIDQISDEAQEGTIVGKAATIEVSPEAAQKIALASKVGTLSLALRKLSDGDLSQDFNTKTIEVSDLKPASGELKKPKTASKASAAYAKYRPKPKVVESSPFSKMIVTRGAQHSTENVVKEADAALAGDADPIVTSSNGYPTGTNSYSSSATSLTGDLNQFTSSVASGVSDTNKVIQAVTPQ